MPDQWHGEWDEEPVGYNYGRGRHWNHGRNAYLVLLLGMVGGVMSIGTFGHVRMLGVLGAVCLLASALAVVGSDLAAGRNADGTRRRPLWTELSCLLAAALLVVAGLASFGASS